MRAVKVILLVVAALACVLAVAVAGLQSGESRQTPTSRTPTERTRPAVAVPNPDPAGSSAAASMAGLDPCVLLDGAVRSAPPGDLLAGLPAGHRYDAECNIYGDEAGNDITVKVELGAELNAFERWSAKPIEVAGMRAFRQQTFPLKVPGYDSGDCTVSVPVGFSLAMRVVVETYEFKRKGSALCPFADRVAGGLVTQTATAPRPSGTPPVRFLRPDEPYRAEPGACGELRGSRDCALPADVEVPDVDELVSNPDPSYICAAAREPVRRAFGPKMMPVVNGEFCEFVDDTHQVRVTIFISSNYDYSQYAQIAKQWPVRSYDIGGHPARLREITDDPWRVQRDWFVRPYPGTPGPDDTRQGVLSLSTEVGGPRGLDEYTSNLDSPGNDPSIGLRGEKVIADILAEHLT